MSVIFFQRETKYYTTPFINFKIGGGGGGGAVDSADDLSTICPYIDPTIPSNHRV